MKNNVYILDGLRTPIGAPFKSLKEFTASQLASSVIKGLITRNDIPKEYVQEIVFGNVVSAGNGQNLARQAALLAGMPDNIVAYMINHVCGSSLQSVINSQRAIKAGDIDLVICGGSESATHAPYLINRKDDISKDDYEAMDSLAVDGLTCQITGKRMGDLVENLAKKYKISREAQDAYAFDSHTKAVYAQEHGLFENEIICLKLANGKEISRDDKPRKNISLERLSALSPTFCKTGTLTPGNSSSPCDGASGILLASEQFVKKYKKIVQARILGYTSISTDPLLSFESAMGAIKDVLRKSSLTLKDMDLFEICEAFAAQAIFVREQLKISKEKCNVYGGDVALGHPLGATGARILITLLNALKQKKLKRGLACVSFGGGGTVALIIELV